MLSERFYLSVKEVIKEELNSGTAVDTVLRSPNLGSMFANMNNYLQFNPVIIIDELDYVYYDFCKYTFSDSEGVNTKEYRDKYKTIVDYFVSFADNHVVQGIYNNSVFIISLRTSTYLLFKELWSQANNLSGNDESGFINHGIKINEHNDETAKDIIRKRLEYKRRHIESYRDRIEHSDSLIKNINDSLVALNSDNDLFNENLAISVHGMRHIMMLLKNAERLDETGLLLKNYICKPGLLKTYQYLDATPSYSSTREAVPNMFLVNKDYVSTKANEDPDYSHLKDTCLLNDHLYIISLKYILFGYIIERYNNNMSTYLSDVIEKFSVLNASEVCKFEKGAVLLVLLHSTEVSHGRLVKLA